MRVFVWRIDQSRPSEKSQSVYTFKKTPQTNHWEVVFKQETDWHPEPYKRGHRHQSIATCTAIFERGPRACSWCPGAYAARTYCKCLLSMLSQPQVVCFFRHPDFKHTVYVSYVSVPGVVSIMYNTSSWCSESMSSEQLMISGTNDCLCIFVIFFYSFPEVLKKLYACLRWCLHHTSSCLIFLLLLCVFIDCDTTTLSYTVSSALTGLYLSQCKISAI